MNNLDLNYYSTDDEQQSSVEYKRNYYVGGSEMKSLLNAYEKGDLMEYVFDKMIVSPVPKSTSEEQPDWAVYGHVMEPRIRDYINTILHTNYVPASTIVGQTRCNFDGIDLNAEHTIFECKTYSGKYNVTNYIAQVVWYMHTLGVKTCVIAAFSKTTVPGHIIEVKNVTDTELVKRTSIHIIKLEDHKELEERLVKAYNKFCEYYNLVETSPLMKKFLRIYKEENSKATNIIEQFGELL